MNIEVGKFYKARSCEKVRIYATDGSYKGNIIHGAIQEGDAWFVEAWTPDGKALDRGDLKANVRDDIVSEWESPKKVEPRLKAWINSAGNLNYRVGDEWPDESLGFKCETWTRAPWLDEPLTVEQHQDNYHAELGIK